MSSLERAGVRARIRPSLRAAFAAGCLVLGAPAAGGTSLVRAASSKLVAQENLAPARARGSGALEVAVSGAGPAGAAATAVLDVPYVSQTEAMCGAASVVMTLAYWGERDVRPERFSDILRPDGSGIETGDLERATAALGWTALAFAGDLHELERQIRAGRPVVTLLSVAPGRFHYVVVAGLIGERVVVHDPAVSPYQLIDRSRFDAAWAESGRWAMLVLPPDGGSPGEREAGTGATPWNRGSPRIAGLTRTSRGEAERTDAERPDAAASADARARRTAVGESSACRAGVDRAITLARVGDLGRSGETLETAARACPAAARPVRELAALRLRQRHFEEAADLAARATRLEPGDAHATELLAAAHYLRGAEDDALATWDRLGPVTVDRVQLEGGGRSLARVVLGLADVREGERLRAERWLRIRRRLDELPSASATRAHLGPRRDGGVDVALAVHEPGVTRGLPAEAARLVAGALFEKTAAMELRAPARLGERWWTSWRWEAARPHLAVGVDLPGRLGSPGVWSLEGRRASATFATGSTSLVETRKRAALGFATWVAGNVRTSAGLALERWSDRGDGLSAGLGVELRPAEDRLSVALTGAVWQGAGPGFGRFGLDLRWRSGAARQGLVWEGRAGLARASTAAPRSEWPGAGTGASRPARARAHPLHDAGVVTGALFGRTLVHGGIEAVSWDLLPAPAGLPLGLATFLDLAASEDGLGGAASRQADLGLGLRLSLPFGGSVLRLDAARGLVDGATAVSAGLIAEWPGRR